MRHRLAPLLLLLAAVLPAFASAAPEMLPFEADYRVKIRGLGGEMQLSLSGTEEDYRARSRLEARGVAGWFFRGEIAESAEFVVDEPGLVPLRYEGTDTLTGDDTRTIIQFDHAGGVAREWVEGKLNEYPLTERTYDRLSLQFALMQALASGERPEQFVLLDGERKALDIRYQDGVIEVDYGTFDAVRVEHRRPGSSRSTVLWCAPELGFLPVRIEQYRKGKLHVRADLAELRRG